MARTTERIQELRRRRQGRYFDLCREAGACDASSNGRELTGDDLKDLDQVSRDLGKSERMLADDIAASVQFHRLTQQLRDAEGEKVSSTKTVARLNDRIKEAVASRDAANDARNSAKYRCDTEAGRVAEKAYNHAAGEISRLQNETKAARKPLAACELLPKQIVSIATANPWVRGCKDGG
ncbi:MAG: hypothetical protein IID41_05110 [Planctomycetes bacterium]|nr:hypothetical protein [Planctomycetota bacterium]